MILFFFFKQKTAYEMRIRDWSSDVCSSDLVADARISHLARQISDHRVRADAQRLGQLALDALQRRRKNELVHVGGGQTRFAQRGLDGTRCDLGDPLVAGPPLLPCIVDLRARRAEMVDERSEEHTSELQSLMRISYAVFCLKKKTIIYEQNNNKY